MPNDDTLSGASERARSGGSKGQSLSDFASGQGEKSETKRTTIDMPIDKFDLLGQLALDEHRSKKAIVLDAIELYAHDKGYY